MTVSLDPTILDSFLDRYLRGATAPAFVLHATDPARLKQFLRENIPSQFVLRSVPELSELLAQWDEEKIPATHFMDRLQGILGFQGTRSALAMGWLGTKPTWATFLLEWADSHHLPFQNEVWWAGLHFDLYFAILAKSKKPPAEFPAIMDAACAHALAANSRAAQIPKLKYASSVVALCLLNAFRDLFSPPQPAPPSATDLTRLEQVVLWIDAVGIFQGTSWALYYGDEPLQLRADDRDLYQVSALMLLSRTSPELIAADPMLQAIAADLGG